MSCPNCGFVAEPFTDWGFVPDPHPRFSCSHSGWRCRYCRSCSSWWHRIGMEEDSDEGDHKRVDCPECTQFEADNESADLETKLAAAMDK